ncbi:legumain-like [Oppia nitens]|uniref:legumain-like n=1 Tax=Oppia nitens TaxID=1686743 RepID=UPI0023DCC0CF|nr:legumain-like [Oppia nitens]
MKIILILVVCYLAATSAYRFDIPELPVNANGTSWAFLAAGGNGFSLDWSIQADVYHAFQVFKARGVPEENIIVMHLDNQANKKSNPKPGTVINVPGGPDVYHGVPKHYTGLEVTAKNFLGVLRGDETLKQQGKKVLESGPEDNVFVYFMDHGGHQLVAFPHGGYMYAKDLIATFKEMYANKKYQKLVFYLEACESGSMFNTLLPEDINVYAVTSSTPTQSSWAWGYDKVYKEYTAGYFAATWLRNTEQKQTESLDEQFKYIETETAKDYSDPQSGQKWHQNAQHYGDLTVAKQDIGQYEGPKQFKSEVNTGSDEHQEIVSFRDVPVAMAQKAIVQSVTNEDKLQAVEQLEQILIGRQLIDKHFQEFATDLEQLTGLDSQLLVNQRQELLTEGSGDCYQQFVDTFHSKCFNINENPYVLGKLNVFVNICEHLTARQLAIALHQLVGQCETTNTIVGKPEHII